MSAIPPNAIASVLQSGVVQRNAAKDVETARQASTETTRKLTGGPDALVELEIEATDTDTQIHSDSGGGAGGQGRHDANHEEAPAEDDASNETSGVTVDDSGRVHIDLSA
ncbi:MAG: hypothetical protein HBSAPP02_06530 [Phycisphaerae bacterium]|nr:MAG: hypothetical protein HRU71_10230 [Planctomycetia bacterium]RIK65951.1 MAG: hypothetical protein DCC66_13810 [Planctomycetota bacterium]GJQ25621.1 MAG: hypothetical protein HBSAPP02_06530 [Phycisphaerae bacterium]